MSAGSGGSGGSSGAPKKFVFKVPKVPPTLSGPGNQPHAPQQKPAFVPPPSSSVPPPAPTFKLPAPAVTLTRPPKQQPKWKSVTQNPPSQPHRSRSAAGPNLKQQTLQFKPQAPRCGVTAEDVDMDVDDDDCQIIGVSSKTGSYQQQQLLLPQYQNVNVKPSINKVQVAAAPWLQSTSEAATHRIIYQGLAAPKPKLSTIAAVPTPVSKGGPRLNSEAGSSSRIEAPDLIGDFPIDEDDDDFESILMPEWIETKTKNGSNTSTGIGANANKEPELNPEDQNDSEDEADAEEGAFYRLSKFDPFLRLGLLPLEELVSFRFHVASISDRHPPENLVDLAQYCLTYIEGLVSSELSKPANIKDALTALEVFLKRILILFCHSKAELSEATYEEVRRLLDRVWTDHVRGDVDFDFNFSTGDGDERRSVPGRKGPMRPRVGILNLLLANSPSYLEDMLAALIKTTLFPSGAETEVGAGTENDNGSSPPAEFSALLRLCKSNAGNFKLVFNTLYEVWRQVRASATKGAGARGHEQILHFTTQLLDTYTIWIRGRSHNQAQIRSGSGKGKSNLNPWRAYPTRFHPILEFLSAVEEFATAGDPVVRVSMSSVLAHNAPVQGELLRLINALLEEDRAEKTCEDESPTLFFIYTNSVLLHFIGESNSEGLVTSRDYPYLWKAVYANPVLNTLI